LGIVVVVVVVVVVLVLVVVVVDVEVVEVDVVVVEVDEVDVEVELVVEVEADSVVLGTVVVLKVSADVSFCDVCGGIVDTEDNSAVSKKSANSRFSL